jgi:uncharacterized damage-inducible protein DinB
MHADVARLFVDYSVRKLDETARSVEACLRRLNDEQVWRRGAAHENTIGNLILHLCGNIRQWIMHGIGNAPDVRTRDAEFSANDGFTANQLSELFTRTIREANIVIASLSPERLVERTDPQRLGDVSVLDAVYQVVGHVQQHAGQIILLTKQLTGQDLDLTIPRPR